MQPKRIRDKYNTQDIRAWFDEADIDNNGSLSINEYFRWAVCRTSAQVGMTMLMTAFQRYDRDKTGQLDYKEFAKACRDMGFGSSALAIFQTLDNDNTGVITYREVTDAMQQNTPGPAEAKQMILSLAMASDLDKEDAPVCVDTSTWMLRGKDANEVRAGLRKLLADSGTHIADLLKLFDQDGDGKMQVDEMEFIAAMRTHCGYRGSALVLMEVFEMLDSVCGHMHMHSD